MGLPSENGKAAISLNLIPRVRCSSLLVGRCARLLGNTSTRVGRNRVSPCAVTLLASRKPVSSRFPVVCRGSSAESARQNQGEHLALSFLGRNFRSSPCKLPFRAKGESFVLTSVCGQWCKPHRKDERGKRFVTRPRTSRGSVKKLAMNSSPLNSHEYPHDSEEYAIYIVLLEGILRALQFSIPSLRCLSILKSTLRRRAHHEEARIRSAMARCARRFWNDFSCTGTCRRRNTGRPARREHSFCRHQANAARSRTIFVCTTSEVLRERGAPKLTVTVSQQSSPSRDLILIALTALQRPPGRGLTRSCSANITCALRRVVSQHLRNAGDAGCFSRFADHFHANRRCDGYAVWRSAMCRLAWATSHCR